MAETPMESKLSPILSLNNRKLPLTAAILGTFLFIGLMGAYYNRTSWKSPTDDGLIHVRSAEMLVTHGIASFNLSERVEASSSALYTWIAAAGFLAHVPRLKIMWYLLAVGALCSTGTIVLLYAMIRDASSSAWAMLGCFFLAICPATAFWAASAMETPLNTLLEVALVASVLRCENSPKAGRRIKIWILIIVALLLLVRPDGFILPTMIAIYVAGKLGRFRDAAGLVCVTAAVFLALCVCRFLYYGQALPNSVYAKIGGDWAEKLSSAYEMWAIMFVPSAMWVVFLPLFGVFLLELWGVLRRIREKQKPFADISLLPWIGMGMVAYWWAHGGDGYRERMLLSLFPFGIYQWIQILSRSGSSKGESRALMLVLGLALLTPITSFSRYYDFRGSDLSVAPSLTRDMNIAKAIRENHPNVRSGTADKLGFISYVLGPDYDVYDLIGGLADPVLSHIAPQKSAQSGKVIQGHCKFDLEYTLGKEPGFVYMIASTYPELAHAIIPNLNRKYLTEKGYQLSYISSSTSYRVVDVRRKPEDQISNYFQSPEFNIVVYVKES